MSVIPIIASAEDVPGAVRHAERNPNSRWYVAKRAEALGARELVPASWGLTADASAAKRKRASTVQGTDSFPIENKDDVRKAVQAFGRAKDKEKAKKHILSMASKLGAMDLIPDDWKATQASAGLTPSQKRGTMGFMTITAAAANWNADLHPRDREGQFISVGDLMDVFTLSGSTTPMWSGKVVGNAKVDGQDMVDLEVTSDGPTPGKGKTVRVPVTRVSAKADAKAKLDSPAEPAEPVAEAAPDAAPERDRRDIGNVDRTAPKSPAELDAKIAHRVGRADANPQSRVPDADREFYDSPEGQSFKDGTHPTSGKPGWHPAPVNNDPTRMVADKRLWERTDDGLWETQTKNPQGPQTPSAEDASLVEALNRKYDEMTGADEDLFDVSDDEPDVVPVDDPDVGEAIDAYIDSGSFDLAAFNDADVDIAVDDMVTDDPALNRDELRTELTRRANVAANERRAEQDADTAPEDPNYNEDGGLSDDASHSLEDDPDYVADTFDEDEPEKYVPGVDAAEQIADAFGGTPEALEAAREVLAENPEISLDEATDRVDGKLGGYDPYNEQGDSGANAFEQGANGTELTQTAREDMQAFADFFDVDSGDGSWASGLKDYQFEQLAAAIDDFLDDPESVTSWKADKLRDLQSFTERHDLDMHDALVAREQASRLGWSLEEQLRGVLAGEPLEEQNPAALERIEGFLRSNPLRQQSFNPEDPSALTPADVAGEIRSYLDGDGSDDLGFTPDDSDSLGAPGDPEPMTPEQEQFEKDLADETGDLADPPSENHPVPMALRGELASYAQQAADADLDVQPLMDALDDEDSGAADFYDAIGKLETGPDKHDSDRLDDLQAKLKAVGPDDASAGEVVSDTGFQEMSDEDAAAAVDEAKADEPEDTGVIPPDMSPDGSSPLATNPYGGPQPEKGTPEWTAKNTLGMSLMRAADKSSHDYTPEATGDDIASIFNAATNSGAHKELAALMTKLKLGGKQRKRNRDLLDAYRGDGIQQKLDAKDESGAAGIPDAVQSVDDGGDVPEAPADGPDLESLSTQQLSEYHDRVDQGASPEEAFQWVTANNPADAVPEPAPEPESPAAPVEAPEVETDRALSQSPEALSDGALDNNIDNLRALINSGAATPADRSRYAALRREKQAREDAKKSDDQLIAEAQMNWNEALQNGYMVGDVVSTTQHRIDSVLEDLRNGETSILVKDDVEQYLTRAQALAVLRKLGMDTSQFEKAPAGKA